MQLAPYRLRPLDMHLLELMNRHPAGITVAHARGYLGTDYQLTRTCLERLARHGLARKARSSEGRLLYVHA